MDARLYSALAAALGCAALGTAPAAAATGGIAVPTADTSAPSTGSTRLPTGGTRSGDPATAPTTRPPRRPSGGRRRATLTSFSVSGSRLYAYGAPLKVSFAIASRRRTVPVTLRVLQGGATVKSIALGERPAGATQSYSLAGGGDLPIGRLELRVSSPGLRRGARASGVTEISHYGHRLPLGGPFTLPPGGEFGDARPGHTHQGQDMSAAQGTPVVAPRGGTIKHVDYQAAAAGNYVVLDGAGERYDYVFMHLADGTTRVREGQTVRTGQRLADVGSTGRSSGPHLHFEIWDGPWQQGGHPVDPLPFVKRWQAQR